MKKFETPSIEVEELEVLDVIATSGCTDDVADCPDDGGIFSLK